MAIQISCEMDLEERKRAALLKTSHVRKFKKIEMFSGNSGQVFLKKLFFKPVIICDGCHPAFDEQILELKLALIDLTAGIFLR